MSRLQNRFLSHPDPKNGHIGPKKALKQNYNLIITKITSLSPKSVKITKKMGPIKLLKLMKPYKRQVRYLH